jgi:hypothetical protein
VVAWVVEDGSGEFYGRLGHGGLIDQDR